jgi:hypothetical protein
MTRKVPNMTTTNDWLQLCDDIDDGEYDDGLDELAKAIVSRRDIVARRNGRRLMRELKVGDKVKLTNGIKPRYLEGMVGHIQSMADGAAVVKLTRIPTHQGAGRPPAEGFKDRFMVPFAHLVKLDDDATDLGEVDMAANIGDDAEYEDEADAEELDD